MDLGEKGEKDQENAPQVEAPIMEEKAPGRTNIPGGSGQLNKEESLREGLGASIGGTFYKKGVQRVSVEEGPGHPKDGVSGRNYQRGGK